MTAASSLSIDAWSGRIAGAELQSVSSGLRSLPASRRASATWAATVSGEGGGGVCAQPATRSVAAIARALTTSNFMLRFLPWPRVAPNESSSILPVLPILPLHPFRLDVAAHRLADRREEALLAEAAKEPEALELVLDRVLHLGEAEVDAGGAQGLLQLLDDVGSRHV